MKENQIIIKKKREDFRCNKKAACRGKRRLPPFYIKNRNESTARAGDFPEGFLKRSKGFYLSSEDFNMIYKNITEAIFLRRTNRFSAFVCLEEKEIQVHVKNTGRCRELLQEGARVFLEPADNPLRKTKYSLISVCKRNLLVNMDSQAPNQVAAEAIAAGRIPEIGRVSLLRREVVFGNSRFDLYFEHENRRGFIEVKGVTLEEEGICKFPDAPTTRGRKHILELMEAVKAGYEAYVLFVIQMAGTKIFYPHWERDKAFSEALCKGAEAGVKILAYDCKVERDSLTLNKKIFVSLEPPQ